MQYNSMGEVKEKINGSHVETVDVLIEADGTGEWEAPRLKIRNYKKT